MITAMTPRSDQPVRRRRRRRSRASRVGREVSGWLSLLIIGIRKIYHWVMLFILVAIILLVGFAYPLFA
jgi:hypothetical protein